MKINTFIVLAVIIADFYVNPVEIVEGSLVLYCFDSFDRDCDVSGCFFFKDDFGVVSCF